MAFSSLYLFIHLRDKLALNFCMKAEYQTGTLIWINVSIAIFANKK